MSSVVVPSGARISRDRIHLDRTSVDRMSADSDDAIDKVSDGNVIGSEAFSSQTNLVP